VYPSIRLFIRIYWKSTQLSVFVLLSKAQKLGRFDSQMYWKTGAKSGRLLPNWRKKIAFCHRAVLIFEWHTRFQCFTRCLTLDNTDGGKASRVVSERNRDVIATINGKLDSLREGQRTCSPTWIALWPRYTQRFVLYGGP